jgi:predicted ABC-type ATPase
MFAGPNGSGKSELKKVISPELRGQYINPDEIEKQVRVSGFLNPRSYGVEASGDEALAFFRNSTFLKATGLGEECSKLSVARDEIDFSLVSMNSYFAAVAADFVRQRLIDQRASFTFETVMSSPDKVEILRRARSHGYRTYLYYVATEDPEINVSRVLNRVKLGGHGVPEDKIRARYGRSLDLLLDAIRGTDRAYIFDNSGSRIEWIAELTDGGNMEIKTNLIPLWFKSAVLDKMN